MSRFMLNLCRSCIFFFGRAGVYVKRTPFVLGRRHMKERTTFF